MHSSRRDFLQRSATTAAALALSPLAPLSRATAEEPELAESRLALDPAVKAFETRMLKARRIPLDKVRVTGGPLKDAQDADANYLLNLLDADRMMFFYRDRAGLPPKKDKDGKDVVPYSGWDGDNRNLTGHIAGHYLSAVSLMYLATGDARFKARADYLVAEMKVVQDKNGDGYLSALKGGREMWAAVSKGEIESGGFDLNGLWSPWYTLQKTFSGLRDAYRCTGNKTALEVETKFGVWAEGVVKPLTDVQFQKMLLTEHGGIMEVFADLYADTGDKRWLDLSYRFEHRAFTDALKRGQDNLDGKHGNCQIPKLVGAAARYGYVGDTGDILSSAFFWDRVVQHHSYSTGGHGLDEYFGPPDMLSARVNGRACESCNVYNMLKLTRRLFSFRPDAFYADFHERALFNHILASIDTGAGEATPVMRTSYMVPVGRGETQEYQDMQRSFTCCVGSGMESHALHGDGIYYESDDTLWVNLFVPSTAQFTTGGVKLAMETGFPDGDNAKMTLTMPASKVFTLAVRRPGWAGDGPNGFKIKVNGEVIEQPPLADLRAGGAGGRVGGPGGAGLPNVGGNTAAPDPSTYVELNRSWKSGDTVEVTLPKSLRLEPTPDNHNVATIMWGPLVLAGDFGSGERGGRGGVGGGGSAQTPIPVLVADQQVSSWVVPAGTAAGNFTARQVGRVPAATPVVLTDVTLAPFYRTQRRRYSVYFDIYTSAEYDAKTAAALAAERDRVAKLEAATVGFVQPGQMQPERNFNYQSDPNDRVVGRTNGRESRAGTGWFSFDLPVDATKAMAVDVTYLNGQGFTPDPRTFQILVDGTVISPVAAAGRAGGGGTGRGGAAATPPGFYDVQYPLPANLIQGKTKVTVKFQAAATNGAIPPVFGVRTIRTD